LLALLVLINQAFHVLLDLSFKELASVYLFFVLLDLVLQFGDLLILKSDHFIHLVSFVNLSSLASTFVLLACQLRIFESSQFVSGLDVVFKVALCLDFCLF